jgi:hypothetical protein
LSAAHPRALTYYTRAGWQAHSDGSGNSRRAG